MDKECAVRDYANSMATILEFMQETFNGNEKLLLYAGRLAEIGANITREFITDMKL